ncbi:MAG: GNAT family N-acetyltransferase [Anaerolineae bacterium]|jgi:ribosomal protein S18 acetylase RimI-like enzyme|nr:GNAT family N-acetyltransferase [Anaerolineae bacterium]
MPEAVIRPAATGDEEALALVHVRSWQTAYRGILPDSFLDELSVAARVDRWRERIAAPGEGEFSFVAEVTGADRAPVIVGFTGGGPEREGFVGSDGARYDGEVYAIYLLPEWRAQGIGHELMAASAQALIDAAFASVVLWVLKDNAPARSFYEALGGILLGEKPITIGQTPLREVAYGWPDAWELLRAARRVDA